ncbi:MAG: nucleoside 2-deoxyribosyltransferase [Candidatus Buchananbacteria bacterium]|nr:nucleoside 2-deoxyribosyltransferase [Candidatus Buchananbacteria bacterium]
MYSLSVIIFGPLFSLAERQFNLNLAEAIRKKSQGFLRVILPQEEGEKFKAKTGLDFEALYRHNLVNAEKHDLALAILDGADVDSGTCIEIGYRKGKNRRKIVVGVRTDFRSCEDGKVNAMLRICNSIIEYYGSNIDELAGKIVAVFFQIIEYGYCMEIERAVLPPPDKMKTLVRAFLGLAH